METENALIEQQRKAARLQSGRTFRPEGVLGYSPESETALQSLPGYTALRQPLQDKVTGQFFFMLGIDSLDSGSILR